MPNALDLVAMYADGSQYEKGSDENHDVREQLSRISVWLDKRQKGSLIDFGCGTGTLLKHASARGWSVCGVEWDKALANTIANRTGLNVLPKEALGTLEGTADVLHLGDVIEHLTEIENQFPALLRLLKPGGLVIAEGPLQANFTLFNAALRVTRPVMRRLRNTVVAPQHVLLSTLVGQRAFFRRFGLEELEFRLSETNWPAPGSIDLHDLRRPKKILLYAVGTGSRLFSRLNPRRWGNRFFYCGSVNR